MGPHVEIGLRAVVAFFLVLFLTRLIGKGQMGQLTVSDFVNAIAIGSIAANMATDHKENASYYVIGIIVFAALTYLTNFLALKFRPVRKVLEGEPTVVIQNGKMLEKNMRKMLYSVDHLLMQLREKNVFNIADVEFAVAEPNGKLSVLLKSQHQSVTAQDLQLPTRYEGMVSEIIMDGKIIKQNLAQNNLTEDWLYNELKKQGITDPRQVALASLDTDGKLYVDKYDDKLPYQQDITDKPNKH